MISSKFIIATLVSTAIGLPLLSQTDMESALTRYKGNKIVILGEWGASERNKWRETLSADGIFEHGFILLDRGSFTHRDSSGFGVRSVEAFEVWFRQRYSLSNTARWAVLDIQNQLIVSGIQQPAAKELDQMLEQKGVRSPLRKVRDFLKENPDHLDSKADLLREVRRRALHIMPSDQEEDMEDEADLRTWVVLASEVDSVFNSSWLGIEIGFFRQEQDQPERFSKLMRRVFQKHIPSVESALRLEPSNEDLWNIWAWMARSLPEYKWKQLVDSIPLWNISGSNDFRTPSSEVCAWLVEKSMAAGDWDTVIKLARHARSFTSSTERNISSKWEWTPVLGQLPGTFGESTKLEGYPIKSAYAPHLEALLRLGRVEEAHDIYDEMIRREGKTSTDKYKSNNALIAANAARSAGREDIAEIWEQGELITKVPYVNAIWPGPCLFVFSASVFGEYQKAIEAFGRKLSPQLAAATSWGFKDIDSIGWKKDDGERWALLGDTWQVLIQGTGIPDQEELQTILNRNGYEDWASTMEKYLAENGEVPGITLITAQYQIASVGDTMEDHSMETAARRFRKIMAEYPDVLINMGSVTPESDEIDLLRVTPLKDLSEPMLKHIEILLQRKPTSWSLWNQWLFWRDLDESGRRIESILERIKLSPLSDAETVPPFMMNKYWEECKADGNWAKVIELLKVAWNRYFSRVTNPEDVAISFNMNYKDIIGDRVGIHLIEAYLQDNKPREADNIFNAVLDNGGRFRDISKILVLAREKGQERLAREWEEKSGNRGKYTAQTINL